MLQLPRDCFSLELWRLTERAERSWPFFLIFGFPRSIAWPFICFAFSFELSSHFPWCVTGVGIWEGQFVLIGREWRNSVSITSICVNCSVGCTLFLINSLVSLTPLTPLTPLTCDSWYRTPGAFRPYIVVFSEYPSRFIDPYAEQTVCDQWPAEMLRRTLYQPMVKIDTLQANRATRHVLTRYASPRLGGIPLI